MENGKQSTASKQPFGKVKTKARSTYFNQATD